MVGATLTLGFFLVARQLGFAPGLSVLGALLLLLTTPHLYFARTLYSENLQATLVVWSMLAWLRSREQPTRRRLIVLGLLLGLALHAKAILAVLGVAVLIDWLWDRPRARELWRRGVWTFMGALPGLLGWFAYNWVRYGNLLETGYGTERDGVIGFGTPLFAGLHGLLLSPGKSVFLYAPLTFIALFGVRAMARQHPRALCFVAIVGGGVLASTAKWWAWSGDWTWGPRLLMAALPLYALPALWVLLQHGRIARALIALALLFGLFVSVLGISLWPSQYLSVAQSATKSAVGKHERGMPIRDELVLVHQVPELSPIVGHAWLLSRAASGQPWHEGDFYPWQSLGIDAWRVRQDPTPEHVCYWYNRSPTTWVMLALGLSLVLASGLWLRRSLQALSEPNAAQSAPR